MLNDPVHARSSWDRASLLVVWGATLVLLWPAGRWLYVRVSSSEQLAHAFLVVAFALFILIRDSSLRPVWSLGRQATLHLLAAYIFIGIAMATGHAAPVLPAFCAALAALIFTIYGRPATRLAYAVPGTFLVFMVFVLFDARLDWALRAMAGHMSAWMLDLLHQEHSLALILRGEPKLILSVNNHLFEVAAECNGFGLMSGSALLAILLVLLRRIRWFDKLLAVVLSVMLAFLINSLRIVIISLLAPSVPDHYLLMHEAVGITLFLGGLFAVWWLITGLPTAREKSPAEAAPV